MSMRLPVPTLSLSIGLLLLPPAASHSQEPGSGKIPESFRELSKKIGRASCRERVYVLV